jgi:excisionase family DNA binding protein
MTASLSINGPITASEFFENSIDDLWLTSKEAANYLRISVKFLLNLTSNGRVPYYKFGRSNRYLRSELKSLLLTHPKGAKHGNNVR